jgi:DNA-directed RNA polymerase specialized sigma24 family protein
MANKSGHTELDEMLFEALFKQHFRPLCHFAEQFTRDMDAAQDITQKVFLMLWERRQHIDPKQSVQSYLYTAVRSRCLNYIRDHKKYRNRVLDLEVLEDHQAGRAIRRSVRPDSQQCGWGCPGLFRGVCRAGAGAGGGTVGAGLICSIFFLMAAAS